MNFAVQIKLRIDWSEMDLFGHINNVMFAKYIQSARVYCCELLGIMKMLTEERIGFMLASSAIQYKKPLFYPGEITIETKIDFTKTTSFGLIHFVYNEKKEVAAEANDVLVIFDFNTNKKIDIPQSVKTLMKTYEQGI